MKKIVPILLVAVLCCSIISPASAASIISDQELQVMYAQQERDLERASSYFALRMVWASACGNGEIEIGFEVGCARTMNHVGAIEIEVMRKSGDNWIPVQTYEYTDSGMGYLYASDCAIHSDAVYFEGTVGRDYFAYITLKAEDDDGSDTRIMLTNVVTAED